MERIISQPIKLSKMTNTKFNENDTIDNIVFLPKEKSDYFLNVVDNAYISEDRVNPYMQLYHGDIVIKGQKMAAFRIFSEYHRVFNFIKAKLRKCSDCIFTTNVCLYNEEAKNDFKNKVGNYAW